LTELASFRTVPVSLQHFPDILNSVGGLQTAVGQL
jgi:hypothetical protein